MQPERIDRADGADGDEGEAGTAETATESVNRRLVLTLAAATALTVANNYYAQPLLAAIGHIFHLSAGTAGLIVTLSQIGYAAGLVLVVPLGDVLERRRLIVIVLVLSCVSLAGEALAISTAMLLAFALAVGITSVAAQILVPFSASLAGEAERGRVVGTVMSGLLLGILLARTASGVVSQALGWRWVYGIAAALMVALAVLLSRVLPAQPPQVKMRYGALLRSVASLLREEPVVRRRGAYGALTFGAFSVFWTSAAFLLSGPPYHYTEAIIGLFGLLGVAGALAASVAGRLADRGWVRSSTGTFIAAAFLSYGLLALGSHSLPALVAGIVVLDLGAQGTHILNQSRIYTLASEARTRLNSAYMTIYFAGGALGSAASTVAYSRSGWLAVCVVGAVMCGLAFLLWCTELLHR